MKLRSTVRLASERIRLRGRPAVFWARLSEPNWGDDFNPWLYQKLSGRSAAFCGYWRHPKLLLAGSILQVAGPADECWGSGLISAEAGKGISLARVHAVRGKLTAEVLRSSGIEVPAVYGDPGLLPAAFVELPSEKSCKIAVIPHYVDFSDGRRLCQEEGFTLIPVSLGIEEFVKRVAGAERVLSSSLHGLICAESLGIPAHWVRFSDGMLGGDFKFLDYLSGTERDNPSQLPLDFRKLSGAIRRNLNPALPVFDHKACQSRLIQAFPCSSHSLLK